MLRIKELRESRKIKQKEMAEILQVPNNTYNQWENEKRQPDPDMLVKIAEYFGVTVDYLLGRDEEPHKTEKSPSATDGLTNFQSTILQLLECVPEDRQDELASLIESALKMSGLLK
jgi:transcriptional regulator with XRE-family HTH domain